MRIALLVVVGCSACGAEEGLLVEVDITHFAVPDQLDRLQISWMTDGTVAGERLFCCIDSPSPLPSVLLVPNERTPATIGVVVSGLLGDAEVLVSRSATRSGVFQPGTMTRLSQPILLPRPP